MPAEAQKAEWVCQAAGFAVILSRLKCGRAAVRAMSLIPHRKFYPTYAGQAAVA
jgi:hypothetical protein